MLKIEVKTEGENVDVRAEVQGKTSDICMEFVSVLADIADGMDEEEPGAGDAFLQDIVMRLLFGVLKSREGRADGEV